MNGEAAVLTRLSADLSTTRPGPDRATALWVRSRAASDEGRWSAGLRLAQQALQTLDGQSNANPVLRARILVALAYNHSERGDPSRAGDLLDEAARCAEVLPAVRVARGLILVRTGRPDAAVADLDGAVEMLRAAHGPTVLEDLAGALLNRGLLHIVAGRLGPAAADTQAAGDVARRLGRRDIEVMADHNLGFVRYLAGDLPAALAAMEAAAAAGPDAAADGVSALDRARVLTAAGLIDAAGEQVDLALRLFHRNHATADLVEASSVRAELDLLAGKPAAAAVAARLAERTARGRGNHAAAVAARTLALQAARAQRASAREIAPPGTARISSGALRDARAAADLAVEAEAVGLQEEARTALLLQAEALLDAGEVAAARAVASRAGGRPGGRLATTLQARLVDARLALADGNRSAGLAAVRRGLDELSAFRARFGSQDLQAASSVHGRDLARLGLRTAVQTGAPGAILQWLERARGVSTRLPAVRPPADPDLARQLGEFRALYEQSRQALLSGTRDPALEARVRQQRRRIRALAWSAQGSGQVQRPLSLAEVQRRLGADPAGRVVVAYIRGDGALHALVVTAGNAVFRRLGPAAGIQARLRRLTADLDLLAAPRVPESVRRVAQRSAAIGRSALQADLIDPLGALLGTGPLLVTALGALTTVPWGLLPGLGGRAVSVTASISAALAARPDRRAGAGELLAVSGPGLPNGAAEAEAVAGLYPGAVSLTGTAATGTSMLQRIPDGGLLHIAAHGHHETESPLFSYVQLADGPLYGYDIAPNPVLPDHVVLASCDVGRSDDRPGGEPVGLAAALLRSGVSTVVAGVGRISDALAAGVLVEYHRRLRAGDGPAVALAAAVASADGAPVPLCCFGVGA